MSKVLFLWTIILTVKKRSHALLTRTCSAAWYRPRPHGPSPRRPLPNGSLWPCTSRRGHRRRGRSGLSSQLETSVEGVRSMEWARWRNTQNDNHTGLEDIEVSSRTRVQYSLHRRALFCCIYNFVDNTMFSLDCAFVFSSIHVTNQQCARGNENTKLEGRERK